MIIYLPGLLNQLVVLSYASFGRGTTIILQVCSVCSPNQPSKRAQYSPILRILGFCSQWLLCVQSRVPVIDSPTGTLIENLCSPWWENQFLIMLSFIFICYYICLVSCPAQWSTINQLVLWSEVRFLLPLHSVVTNTRHFYFWLLYGNIYVCAIDFNLQCGLSTIIFSRVIIV